MIVFITSIYDKLKTQTCYFINEEGTRLILHDNMPASALDKVVTFASQVLFRKETRRLQSSRSRLLVTEFALRISGQLEELCTLNKNEAQVFLISNLMKQVLKSPDKPKMINDLIKNLQRKMQQESITILYHTEIQKFMLWTKGQQGTTWSCQRSKIVFSPKYASKIHRPGETFRICEACYKAIPRRSRSRQSNESTVESSCASFEHHMLAFDECSKGSTWWKICRITKNQKSKRLIEFREDALLRKDRGALHRGRAESKAHARTTIHAVRHGRIWQNSQCKEEWRSCPWGKGVLQRSIQGWTTQSRRRQQHR